MRILVVDDAYMARSQLAGLLSTYGLCEAAPNGEIALMLFKEAHQEMVPYDLVTMDIEMPGMDGKAVVNEMRNIESALQIDGATGVKILMVTVATAMKAVSGSYHCGCSGYLVKPITQESLRKALEELGVTGRK